MCKILLEARCDLTIQDNLHKSAHHYAKKNGKTDVADYLFNEYQILKEQRKGLQTDSRPGEDSHTENPNKPSRGIKNVRDRNNAPTKSMYRLYRADNLGNAN